MVEIHNTNTFSCGAFILNKDRKSYCPCVSFSEIYLTQKDNISLKNEILKIIKEAKTVIKVCSFIITDQEIYDALQERILSHSLSVFILTQLDNSKISDTSYLTDEESTEQTKRQHLSYIRSLYDNGAHVRASSSAHAKFIIADRNIGFVMSANITTPSLTYNTESAIYLNQTDSRQLDCLFDVIFQKGTSYRKFVSSSKKGKQFVVQAESNIREEWLPSVVDCNLRYTLNNIENNLLDEILLIINQSNEFLFISTYSIVGLQKLPTFIDAITNAIARGVSINVFCRGMNYRPDHVSGCLTLLKVGCRIYGDYFNHSKGIVNETSGLMFTANIDGNYGLTNGFEVGCLLSEPQRLEFLKLHQELISMSEFEFTNAPTRLSLFEAYTQYESYKNIKPPIFEKDITISVPRAFQHVLDELQNVPIYYGRIGGKSREQYLIFGKQYYKISYDFSKIQLIEKSEPNYNLEKYILKYNTLKIFLN